MLYNDRAFVRALLPTQADIQPNDGCYRPLTIITRPGSLLDPPPESPVVGGNHETNQRVADAIFLALEAAIPERLTAGGSTTSGLLLFSGRHPRDGRWTTFYETHGGGEGGRVDRDGMAVVMAELKRCGLLFLDSRTVGATVGVGSGVGAGGTEVAMSEEQATIRAAAASAKPVTAWPRKEWTARKRLFMNFLTSMM